MSVDLTVPRLSLTMEEATVVRWLRQEGDTVEKDDVVAEIAIDKANVELVAPTAGVLSKIHVLAGEAAQVGHALATITEPGETYAPPREVTGNLEPESDPPRRFRASPRVRRVANELGIDLSLIGGTGVGGRIVEKDLREYIEFQKRSSTTVATAPEVSQAAPHRGPDTATVAHVTAPPNLQPIPSVDAAPFDIVPLTPARRATANLMLQAALVPQVTLNTRADATELLDLKAHLAKPVHDRTGLRLSVTDFLLKAISWALRQHGEINASYTEAGIRRYNQVNVGLAVDTEASLLVPVVKRADELSLVQLAKERRRLVDLCLTGKIGPADLAGGTFTLTNLGAYDVESFTPLLNPPQGGIMGVGRIVPEVAETDGQLGRRHVIGLSLTFDHRLIDGAPAARFLQTVKSFIEMPQLLM